MERILKLLQVKENEIDNGMLSIRIFCDGSGYVIDESQTEIFEYDNKKELLEWLT